MVSRSVMLLSGSLAFTGGAMGDYVLAECE
jgi:hypothetical protein